MTLAERIKKERKALMREKENFMRKKQWHMGEY